MKTMPELAPTTTETHISSLVVLCRPEVLNAAKAEIEHFEFAEVHAVDESGKIIVVLESACQKGLLNHIDMIETVSGVISATMVYHQVD